MIGPLSLVVSQEEHLSSMSVRNSFGILCFLVGGPWQYLLAAIAVTCGYLIPGLMLRNNPD